MSYSGKTLKLPMVRDYLLQHTVPGQTYTRNELFDLVHDKHEAAGGLQPEVKNPLEQVTKAAKDLAHLEYFEHAGYGQYKRTAKDTSEIVTETAAYGAISNRAEITMSAGRETVYGWYSQNDRTWRRNWTERASSP